MAAPKRVYSFEEWMALPDEDRRKIPWQWNPYDPEEETGLQTRVAIAGAFQEKHPGLAARPVKVGYFDKEGWCLVVVVENRSTPVPSSFGGLRIVKGLGKPGEPIQWLRM